LETFASAAMASVLAAAKPWRRNTLRAPAKIWSRFALALGSRSSVLITNEPIYLSKLNSTVYYESAYGFVKVILGCTLRHEPRALWCFW
jgi:hypothetical protein